MVVDANQLVMCANGDGHVIESGIAKKTHSFEKVMFAAAFEPDGGGIGHTEVVCGVFLL